jgi:hypothetical protein
MGNCLKTGRFEHKMAITARMRVGLFLTRIGKNWRGQGGRIQPRKMRKREPTAKAEIFTEANKGNGGGEGNWI